MNTTEHDPIFINGYPAPCPAFGVNPICETQENTDPLGLFEAVCREYRIPARITEFKTFGLPYFTKMEFDGWRCRYCGIVFRARP